MTSELGTGRTLDWRETCILIRALCLSPFETVIKPIEDLGFFFFFVYGGVSSSQDLSALKIFKFLITIVFTKHSA